LTTNSPRSPPSPRAPTRAADQAAFRDHWGYTPATDAEWRRTLDNPVIIFVGRSDDPDVVAQLPRDSFEQAQAAGIHAIVVGEQDSHG